MYPYVLIYALLGSCIASASAQTVGGDADGADGIIANDAGGGEDGPSNGGAGGNGCKFAGVNIAGFDFGRDAPVNILSTPQIPSQVLD